MVLEALDAEVREYIEGQKAEAQSVIKELTKKYAEENHLLKLQYLELKERYDLLLYKRFGRAAEQLLRDKKQPLLFDEGKGVPAGGGTGSLSAEAREIRSYKRRSSGGRKAIDPAIPREDHIIDLPEAEKKCACGAEMERIGEEVSERLHIEPPRLKTRFLHLLVRLSLHQKEAAVFYPGAVVPPLVQTA
jgi:transposase